MIFEAYCISESLVYFVCCMCVHLVDEYFNPIIYSSRMSETPEKVGIFEAIMAVQRGHTPRGSFSFDQLHQSIILT